MSFLQIYNETVLDLLEETEKLDIRESKLKGIFVQGL